LGQKIFLRQVHITNLHNGESTDIGRYGGRYKYVPFELVFGRPRQSESYSDTHDLSATEFILSVC